MIDIQKTPEKFLAVLDDDQTLPYLSITLQGCVEWFLQHGVHSFEIKRKTEGAFCTILGKALVVPKPLVFSNTASIRTLVDIDYFPNTLFETWTGLRMQTGATRMSTSLNSQESVISMGELNTIVPISEYSWGQADIIIELFTLGSTIIRHRGSVEKIQTWFNIGLSDEERQKLVDDTHLGYDPSRLIRTLP